MAPPGCGDGDTKGLGELGCRGPSSPPQDPIRAAARSAAACPTAPRGRRAKGHFMRRWTSKTTCYSSVRARVNPRRRSRLEQNDEPPRRPVAIQSAVSDPGRSALSKYQDLVVGSRSLLRLALHEIVVLTTSWVPGALGLALR